MSGRTIRVAGLTDVGRTRDHNEDCYLLWHFGRDERIEGSDEASVPRSDGVLMSVCDGMGGAAAGERASEIAVDTLADRAAELGEEKLELSTFIEWLEESVKEADRRILEAAQADPELEGMGSTMTTVAAIPEGLALGHVGDSRAYHLRDGHLRQISVDHSYVGELVALGRITPDEARTHDQRNLLLQVLGLGRPLEVDRVAIALREGDMLMLCSDGLYDLVEDPEIKELMLADDDLAARCRELIQLANERGGKDNITVIVARVE